MKNSSQSKLERKIRTLIWVFIVGLAISGITAFPLEWELSLCNDWVINHLNEDNALRYWIVKTYAGVTETNQKFPFMAYGTDWLAFAHLVIAISFFGPLRDPVKNIWIIEFGMIACVSVIPLAFIAGSIREIPVYWRIIDCSFGIFGIFPLWYTRRLIKKLEIVKKKIN